MKTRPRPPLTLREIWENPDDYGSDKVFTSLAVGLENTDNNLDYLESDLTEETERRMEDISALQARISCSHPMLQDLEDAGLEMMSDTREELSSIKARQSEAVYMRDMPEILEDICKRLDRLERSVQLLKFPEMLKG